MMKHTRIWKWLAMVVIVLLSLLWATPVAFAAKFRSGDRVVIGPDEVIEDDLYVGAGKIVVEGTIKGDLVAAGGEIAINGTVEGDLMAAGGHLTVNGTVQDDVRIAGRLLYVGRNAKIGDDVFAAGYGFEAASGSAIGGGLFVGAGQTRLGGDIKGDVNASTGALEIAGHIGGDVNAKVREPEPQFERMQPFFAMWMPAPIIAPGFRLSDEAVIEGKLTYTSRAEAGISAGAEVKGGIEYRMPPAPPPGKRVTPARAALNQFLGHLRRLVTLLVIGLLALWLVPSRMGEAAAALRSKPWSSLGWGVVFATAVFVAILTVLIGMIILDIILGLLGLGGLVASLTGAGLIADATIVVGFLIVAFYVTKAVFGFLAGRLLLERVRPAWAAGRFWPLVVGLVLFVVFRAIPRIGWLIDLFVTLFGLGAIWLMGREALCRPAPPA